jgi:hypothetical protein
MDARMFNLVGTLTNIKNFILDAGPQGLRRGADALSMLERAAREAADFIDQFGAAVPFGAAGAPALAAGAEEQISALRDLKAEVDAARGQAAKDHDKLQGEFQRQMAVDVQAGLLDWLGKVDPEWKTHLLALLSNLIGKILTKAGEKPTVPASATKAAPAAAPGRKDK